MRYLFVDWYADDPGGWGTDVYIKYSTVNLNELKERLNGLAPRGVRSQPARPFFIYVFELAQGKLLGSIETDKLLNLDEFDPKYIQFGPKGERT